MYHTHKVFWKIAGGMGQPPYAGHRKVTALNAESAKQRAVKSVRSVFPETPVANITITSVERLNT